MLSLCSASLSFNVPGVPSGIARSQPTMQLREAVGVAGVATAAGGVVPTRGRVGTDEAILVQGGSLRTWSYRSQAVEQVQVVLSTEGRPLDADVELWHGPDNTPCKMRVYVENGQLRPFSAVIETPRGPNTVAVRNIGQVEFPLAANVAAANVDQPLQDTLTSSTTVQGGALRTYAFDPSVDSVELLLRGHHWRTNFASSLCRRATEDTSHGNGTVSKRDSAISRSLVNDGQCVHVNAQSSHLQAERVVSHGVQRNSNRGAFKLGSVVGVDAQRVIHETIVCFVCNRDCNHLQRSALLNGGYERCETL